MSGVLAIPLVCCSAILANGRPSRSGQRVHALWELMDRLGNPEPDEHVRDIVHATDCRSIVATALAEKPFEIGRAHV